MVAIKDMLDGQTVIRADGRKVDELRPVRITRHFTDVPEGSVLVQYASDVHGHVHRRRATLAQGLRLGLGHRGICDAAASHCRPHRS